MPMQILLSISGLHYVLDRMVGGMILPIAMLNLTNVQ